jgi:hypothetical protein
MPRQPVRCHDAEDKSASDHTGLELLYGTARAREEDQLVLPCSGNYLRQRITIFPVKHWFPL